MDKECEYCGDLYLPVGGDGDLIIEAPDCDCIFEKQLANDNNPCGWGRP